MNTPAYHPKAVLKARIEELEKLNAELLEALKDCMAMSLLTSSKWDEAVAKAEEDPL